MAAPLTRTCRSQTSIRTRVRAWDGGDVARRVRLRAGGRRAPSRRRDSLLLRRHARTRSSPTHAPSSACTLRCTAARASPRSGATSRAPSRSGARRRATRATRTTAISTATSASISRSITWRRTCRPEGCKSLHRGEVLRHHAPKAARQEALRSARRVPPSGRARGQLHAQPRAAGRAPPRPDGRQPIVVSPYDAELFGHWWYEGPMFLELLFRKMHYDQGSLEPITPSGYLRVHPSNQVATPCASSWGEKGYFEFWCDQLERLGVSRTCTRWESACASWPVAFQASTACSGAL